MQTLITVALLVFVVWFVVRYGRLTTSSQQPEKRESPAVRESKYVPAFHWPGGHDFEFEVVGESNYQRALAAHACHADYEQTECLAVLWPQPDNPHDKMAVAVLIDDDVVGYLSKEDARSFRRRLAAKKLGVVATSCDAVIVGGGTRRDGEKLFFGVRLDIKPFDD